MVRPSNMNEETIRCWYVSIPRLLEIIDARAVPAQLMHAFGAPDNYLSKMAISALLGPQLIGYLRREEVRPFHRLAAEGKLKPGLRFTYQGHFYGKGFGFANKSPLVSLSENLVDIVPGKKLVLNFSKSGLMNDTAYTRLSGSTNLFAFCTIAEINDTIIDGIPYLIGDLIEGSKTGLGLPLADRLSISVQSLDQFKGIDFSWNPSPKQFIQLKNVPEQKVKAVICDLLGEVEVPKDWGGEECDLFTSNISIDNNKLTAAFLLKGPAKFHEMTLADCGKNGDQIYRLFNTPADIFIVQHCHKITPAVRKTVEAFALSTYSRNCAYTLIDGYDTARILHSSGVL